MLRHLRLRVLRYLGLLRHLRLRILRDLRYLRLRELGLRRLRLLGRLNFRRPLCLFRSLGLFCNGGLFRNLRLFRRRSLLSLAGKAVLGSCFRNGGGSPGIFLPQRGHGDEGQQQNRKDYAPKFEKP